MSNRRIAFIVKDQNPLVLAENDTVQIACEHMWARRVGAVLIAGADGRLTGIFTGRDAVRTLAEGHQPDATTLAQAMTSDPDTIGPERNAIDALRMMSDGGYRHLPIIAGGTIAGIVSRGDFKGFELERLENETHLWECIS